MSECPGCGGDCIPLCGDETCEAQSDRQCAIDAFHARQQEDARVYVRTLLGLEP